MRAKSMLLVGVLGLAIICLSLGAGVDAGPEPKDKPEPAQKTAAEIEKLVKDLGSTKFETRDSASKRLREIPSAIHYLRRNLTGKDAETHARMQALIAELSRVVFNRRMAELFRAKEAAPIDLVAEMMLQHRDLVEKHHWVQLFDTVAAIGGKLSEGRGKNPCLIFREQEFLAGQVCGEDLSQDVFTGRAIINRINCDRISISAVIASQSLSAEALNASVLLTTGISTPDPGLRATTKRMHGCFMYADGDVACQSIHYSVVIARGQIKQTKPGENTILIERAWHSRLVKLFSVENVGFKLTDEKGDVWVKAVVEKSAAARCGIKPGDVIVTDSTADRVSGLERSLRKSYALQADHALKIRREGREISVRLSLID